MSDSVLPSYPRCHDIQLSAQDDGSVQTSDILAVEGYLVLFAEDGPLVRMVFCNRLGKLHRAYEAMDLERLPLEMLRSAAKSRNWVRVSRDGTVMLYLDELPTMTEWVEGAS